MKGVMFAALLASACSGPGTASIATDGSPEAGLVAEWLRGGDSAWLLAPDARLAMSDYSEDLTLANLRKLGPDHISGCHASSARKFRAAVLVLWDCARSVPEIRRRVLFYVVGNRIRSAQYIEADMMGGEPQAAS